MFRSTGISIRPCSNGAKQTRREEGRGFWPCRWCTYHGKRVASIKTAWSRAKREAGVTRKLRPYDLRHAFATYALRAGSDIHAVSQVMGHSRPDTTMRVYQHVSRDQHVAAVDSIPSLPLDDVDNVVRTNRRDKSNN